MDTLNVGGGGSSCVMNYSTSQSDMALTFYIASFSVNTNTHVKYAMVKDIASNTVICDSRDYVGGSSGWYDPDAVYIDDDWSYSRGHSSQTRNFNLIISVLTNEQAGTYTTYTKAFSLTIPAKASYTVSFDGNGHNGTSSQTKWYNEALSVQSNPFSRPGYRFVEWNTAADGTGTAYSPGDSYTSNAALSLYAIWKRNIDSVTIGSTTAIRVESSSSTIEADEGEYAYVRIPFTVTGAAAATVTLTASLADQDGNAVDTFIAGTGQTYDSTSHVLTQELSSSSGKPETEADFTGVFVLRASGCSADKTYTMAVAVTASNTSETQADVSDSRGVLIATAYFTMDLLGESHYYNLTTDSSVNSSKTYYTRSGSGTSASPYVYTPVANPTAQDLAAYYEANGAKPGHGVSFGAPATHEGFDVSMPQYSYGVRCFQVFEFDTAANADANTTIPRPFYCYCTADGGFYRVTT